MCVWRMILVWGVCGGGYFCGVHLWGLAEYAWYVSFRMCSLDRIRSIHTGGSQNTPDMCLLVWGNTYQAYSTCVGCVWRRILGMCLFSTFTHGQTEHARGSKLDGTYCPFVFLFFFFFSRRRWRREHSGGAKFARADSQIHPRV